MGAGPSFLTGVQSVVGNRLQEEHERDLAQKVAEQKFYFDRLHDPSFSATPILDTDAPEVKAQKQAENQQKAAQLKHAQDEYLKRSPKAAKNIFQVVGPWLQRIHGHDQAGAAGAQASAAAGQAPSPTVPAPPQGGIATPPFLPPGTASAPAMPPPPRAIEEDLLPGNASARPAASTASVAPQATTPAAPAPVAAPSPARAAAIPPPPTSDADLAYTSWQGGLSRSKQEEQAKQDILTASKLKEEAGTAKFPVMQWDPSGGMRTTFVSGTGEQIGKPIENSVLSKLMGAGMIHPVSIADPATGQPIPALQNKYTGAVYDQNLNPIPDAKVFNASAQVGRQSATVDPFGNVTTTTRKPIVGGKAGVGAGPRGIGIGAGTSVTAPTGRIGGGGGRPPAVPPPLDSEGHIPLVQGVNQQLIENANQLLDGQDITKLPQRARTGAAAMARRYGWEQGKFTPKEQTQIREASTFLQSAASDPALAALDDGPLARAQLAQITRNPDKLGTFGTAMTSYLAQNMDPKQTAFLQMYNQLVGTIAGLSKLVRPGGTTEAQIERLKSELPNPITTKDSADARARIQRLLKEIDVAMTKGNFTGLDQGVAGPKRPPAIPAPSSAIFARDPQGKLHQAPAGTKVPQGWKVEHNAPASQ